MNRYGDRRSGGRWVAWQADVVQLLVFVVLEFLISLILHFVFLILLILPIH